MPIQANRTSVNTVSARESSSIIGGAVLLGVGKHGRFGAKREDDWRPMWMRNARKRREPDEVPRAPVTSCFGKEKRRRGDKPRALQCYLFFFAVLRRAKAARIQGATLRRAPTHHVCQNSQRLFSMSLLRAG